MSSSRVVQTTVFLLALLTMVGCSPTLRRPQFLHPGPAWYQRENATQFDPYPQNDVGPEIVGGRPIDYLKPHDEVTRGRQYRPPGGVSVGPRY